MDHNICQLTQRLLDLIADALTAIGNRAELSDAEYYRLLQPIGDPFHDLCLLLSSHPQQDLTAAMFGRESDQERAIGLLTEALNRIMVWPVGGIGPIVYARLPLTALVSTLQEVRGQLAVVCRLLGQDPWSKGRMTRQWLKENSDLLCKQFENIRTKNPDRVRDAGGCGRGPWQLRKSLCHEYGLNCPEFPESSP